MVNIRCSEDTPFFNEAEADVLALMRGKQNGKIEIHLHEGKVCRIKNTTELHTIDKKDIPVRIDEMEYGEYRIKKQNGRIVRVLDEGSLKYDPKTGKRMTK
jgi:hypothetical protein